MTINRSNPARGGEEIVIGDAFRPCRGIWVGSVGDVNVEFTDGGSAIYKNVEGTLPVEAVRVLASGTTASDMTTLL